MPVWLLNQLQINGTFVNVPTSYTKEAQATTTLPSGTQVKIELTNVVSEKIALMLVLDVPGAAFFILANKPQAFSRFLTRCSFDAEGIHCRSPRWGRFTLRWDEIRTYGFGVNSFSYMSASFLYFSRNEEEYVPKNGMELLRIGRDRIIFQYRESIWAARSEYMPRDMVKRLDDVIRNERGGHFRRRPGA